MILTIPIEDLKKGDTIRYRYKKDNTLAKFKVLKIIGNSLILQKSKHEYSFNSHTRSFSSLVEIDRSDKKIAQIEARSKVNKRVRLSDEELKRCVDLDKGLYLTNEMDKLAVKYNKSKGFFFNQIKKYVKSTGYVRRLRKTV